MNLLRQIPAYLIEVQTTTGEHGGRAFAVQETSEFGDAEAAKTDSEWWADTEGHIAGRQK